VPEEGDPADARLAGIRFDHRALAAHRREEVLQRAGFGGLDLLREFGQARAVECRFAGESGAGEQEKQPKGADSSMHVPRTSPGDGKLGQSGEEDRQEDRSRACSRPHSGQESGVAQRS
jgi:hypothetical protein